MKRFGLTGLAAAVACMASAGAARADVTFFEKDGWSLYTRGLIASNFQYVIGDGDPNTTHGVLTGGKIVPGTATDPRGECTTTLVAGVPQETCTPKLTLARVRSGFIGTQLGVGVRRRITDTVKVDSLVAINLADISSNRNQEGNKSVDVREAWASVETPGGTFKLGRSFMIFGSGSAPVVLISHKFAVGNPCFVNAPTIACASVGAGPLYAGFDAQLRYETPRFVGVQFRVAMSDPWVGPGYGITPLPRFDADLNFDQQFTETVRVRAFAQGVFQQVQRRNDKVLQKGTVIGGMGTAVVNVAGLAVGGGGWQCKGCGTRTVFEVGDFANPLAYDSKYELRTARGYFGNAGYTFLGYTLAAGAGMAFVRATDTDAPERTIDPMTGLPRAQNSSISILHSSLEYHVTFTKEIDALALTAEFMNWTNKWHYGEKQNQIYTGVGAAYNW